MNLAWSGSTDSGGSGLKGYNIYRNGTYVQQALAPATTTTDSGLSASTVYSYTVRAIDNAGNLSASSNTASANTPACNLPPVADPGLNQAIPVAMPVTVDGRDSYDPDGTINSYTWNFGDGATGSGMTAQHTYGATGTYSAALTVKDNLGATNSSSALVTVTTGGAYRWSEAFGGPVDDRGLAVALDGGGNTLMTGFFHGTVDFGGGPLTSTHYPWLDANNYEDVFLAKYSPAGVYMWAKQLGAEADDAGTAIATDGNGDVVIAGTYQNDVNFGSGTPTAGHGANDAFVAKYAGTDGHYLWARGFSSGGDEYGSGVAVDTSNTSNNVVVTGEFQNSIDFGGGALTSAGSGDIFLAKYAGSNGGYLWAKRFGGVGGDNGTDVAVDSAGNVVAVGGFSASVDFGGGPLTSAGNVDIFVAKYAGTDGHYLWAKRFGSTGADSPSKVAVDSAGNVTVIGVFQNTVDFGGGPLTSAGGNDIFVVQIAGTDGHYLWGKRFGGTGADYGNGVRIGPNNSVLITGAYSGTVDFGGGALTSQGTDAFVAKYSAAGAYVWANRYGGTLDQYGTAVAADGTGTVVMTGSFANRIDFGGGSFLSAGSYDVSLVKLVP
jgi:chitodextrinase